MSDMILTLLYRRPLYYWMILTQC